MALSRTKARLRRSLRLAVVILSFATLGALAFVVGAFFHGIGSIPLENWRALTHVAALFAILGALFGTVLALDRSADVPPFMLRIVRRFEAPYLRTAICAMLGVIAVLFVRSWHPNSFPSAWSVVGAVVGAVLGWFGWRWAKYVDF